MTREQFISKVEATQKALRRFLVALCCGDGDLADDIAQESYIKAYLSCGSFGNLEKFNPWIFRIAYNTFINHRRSRRLTTNIVEAARVPANDGADSSFMYQDLYLALNRLTAKERIAVLLFYMQGYSIQEIAEIQEISQDAVKQQLSRGRTHLRNLLTDE